MLYTKRDMTQKKQVLAQRKVRLGLRLTNKVVKG